MNGFKLALLLVALLFQPGALSAQENEHAIGGDLFLAGDTVGIARPLANDLFAAGRDISTNSDIGGDMHAMGFSIRIAAPVDGSVYAAGYSVAVAGTVGDDLLAMGYDVSVEPDGRVEGNVRLAGQTVTIDGAVAGSASLAGQTGHVGGTIGGDFEFAGQDLQFGEGATIGGQVTIRAVEDVEVPASVASASRVTFIRIDTSEFEALRGTEIQKMVSPWGWLWGTLGLGAVLFVIGAILLLIAPKRGEVLYRISHGKPFRGMVAGLLLMALVIGLTPALAMTLVGLPLVPFAIVGAIVLSIAGYVAGAYFLARRVFEGLPFAGRGIGFNLLALAIGVAVLPLVHMIPFVGWIASLAVTFFGLGTLALNLSARWLDRDFYLGVESDVYGGPGGPRAR